MSDEALPSGSARPLAGPKPKTTSPPSLLPAGFAVLRTARLPLSCLLDWVEGSALPDARAAGDAEVLAAAGRLEQRLRAMVSPEVREAILVASAGLGAAFDACAGSSDPARPDAVLAVTRYFTRMCGRATPFGLFASIGVVDVAERSRLAPLGQAALRRRTRLDMEAVHRLVDRLSGDPGLAARFHHFPNETLYRLGDRWLYFERRDPGGNQPAAFQFVSVDASSHLDQALSAAAGGATLQEIAARIAGPDTTLESAREFVGDLVAAQLLVSEIVPPATGLSPLSWLRDRLVARAPESPARRLLDDTAAALADLDATITPKSTDRYQAIALPLAATPEEAAASRLFQVDLIRERGPLRIGEAVLAEVARGVELLSRLSPPPPSNAALQTFIEKFRQRYEGREVPLAEALDETSGIGFAGGGMTALDPAPLLDDLPALGSAGRAAGIVSSGAVERRFAARCLTDSAHDQEWILNRTDLDALSAATPHPFPRSLAAFCVLAARSPAALDSGDFQVLLDGVHGPSGAVMLGRFCDASPELLERVREYLAREEALDPEALYAEISHLPEGRRGNIVLRPILRRHEIAYGGRAGVPPEDQLPLSDLWLSLPADRLELRSARHNRRVVPRLTSAFNPGRAQLPIVRFLCALQDEGAPAPAWNWGTLEGAPFLPRVRHGRIVLSVARWLLGREELSSLAGNSDAEVLRAAQHLAEKLRLPRLVALTDRDNMLLVDFHNVLSVAAFARLVRGRARAELRELWPAMESMPVGDSEGRFVHELIVPFTCPSSPPYWPALAVAPAPPVHEGATLGRRTFVPGSEWLYLKLYGGTATADDLLLEVVAPAVRAALDAGEAGGWFFIRYADPDPHLRLRLTGVPDRLLSETLPRIRQALAPFLEDGRLHRLSLDTYQRELERYGGLPALPAVERIFQHDSDACLRLIAATRGDGGQEARWQSTLAGMHALLEAMGLSMAQRIALLEGVRAAMAEEQGAAADHEHALGRSFRRHRARIDSLLRDGQVAPDVREALAHRKRQLEPCFRELLHLQVQGRLGVSWPALAGSLLHMHANRMLRARARSQEFVIYDFLLRAYQSARARVEKAALR